MARNMRAVTRRYRSTFNLPTRCFNLYITANIFLYLIALMSFLTRYLIICSFHHQKYLVAGCRMKLNIRLTLYCRT